MRKTNEMSDEEREAMKDKVFSVIQEQLQVDLKEITPEKSFTDDLEADSLDKVELVMAFEVTFDIEISDDDAEKIKTVKDAIVAITERIKEKSPLKS